MKPPLFRYVAPNTLEQAVAALAADADAMVLAGGQSLLPAMNFRLSNPSLLVDIQHVRDLHGMVFANGSVVIKAMTRHREVELNERLRAENPLIAEAMAHVAHIAIRNRGTVVGSLCHADAAAEMPLILVLLGGTVVLQGLAGRREVAAEEFFRFHLTTSRRHDEIAVEARFPLLSAETGWAFDEVTRRHGDYAIAGLGSLVRLGPDGHAREVRLAACGIAVRPIRLAEAERRLVGTALREVDLDEAAQLAAQAVTAEDDLHATQAYRRRLLATLVRRLVEKAASRARERRAP